MDDLVIMTDSLFHPMRPMIQYNEFKCGIDHFCHYTSHLVQRNKLILAVSSSRLAMFAMPESL